MRDDLGCHFKWDDEPLEVFQKSGMIKCSLYKLMLVALLGRDFIGSRVEAEIS